MIVLQDLPFYTKSRIAIYDYLGELEFGSKHDSGQGWFFNKEEFLSTWQQNPHAILVVPQKYKQECLTELNDENAVIYFETNKYLIITHN